MSNYQTVNLPRELAERIAKVCMFTMFAQDSQDLRAILARPSGKPSAWFDPVHNDFLTAAGRATAISMGDGDRLARYTVPLYAAPTAAEELDSVRHWRGKHAEAIRERDDLQKRWDSINSAYQRRTAMNDQLQADLTGRDQRLDQFQQVLLKLHQNLGGTLEQYGLHEEVEALLWPDLHSRPEERGTPEDEPCSGCGTPGYTGNCYKCVPY